MWKWWSGRIERRERLNGWHPVVVLRLTRLAISLLLQIVILLLQVRAGPSRMKRRQALARAVLRSLGIRVVMAGKPPPASLLVANHISWLDILLVVMTTDACFVAKREVAEWPFIGWLATRTGTIFLKRQCARSAFAAKQRIAEELAAGRSFLVFAEGTTTGGEDVLPFRTALLQGAIDAGAPICPVCISYRSKGSVCGAAAFVDDMLLGHSILEVARVPRLSAHLAYLKPLRAGPSRPPGASRKRLAWLARDAVRTTLVNRGADTNLQLPVQESVRVSR